MGVSAGFDLLYVGGAGSVRGSRFDAALIAACTSCSAASMLRSSANCSVTCELPKLETEVIEVSEGIWPNCRSSGVVTVAAMVSPLAPGSSVELGGYSFQLDGVTARQGPNYKSDYGTVSIEHSGSIISQLHPEKRLYDSTGSLQTESAVDFNLMRDLYVAMGEPMDNGDWTLRLYLKPMMRMVWLGGVLMFLGGLLAATDRRYRLSRATEHAAADVALVAAADA